ncbi:hypothetical protein HDU89_007600 [Geranomyces variabilis]|nr:hypothetical protein HDU89_007600 [Geranomyces variabilis]
MVFRDIRRPKRSDYHIPISGFGTCVPLSDSAWALTLTQVTYPEHRIEERERYQCVITGEFSRPIHPDQGSGPCEAAHIFPFGLAAYVRKKVHRLSRLVYPPELFWLMRAGSNIDSLTNGMLLQQGVHDLSFGVLWWIEHDGTAYRVHNPGKTRFVTDQATLSFNDPAPNPTLMNIHACMAQIRRNLTLLKLWTPLESAPTFLTMTTTI